MLALILGSRKPEAKAYKRWATHEVLPSIHKTGGYIAGQESLSGDELLAKAVLFAQNKINEQATLIHAMEPKAVFADAVSTSDTTILIGELAKLLRQNGIEIGEKRLFGWLRENGYLIRRKGTDYNAPTQRAMEMGLFRVKETAITHADGHVTVSKTTKVTGKGQQYFINMFLGKQVELVS
jgi:anti-repressor protein